MSWWDDNAPEPLSPAEQTYANQTAAREAYYKANPKLDPTPSFTNNERAGLADIVDRNIAINMPDKPKPGPGSGGGPNLSPQAFIQQWQGSHSANEGIGALADAMKAAGYTNVSRFMYGSTPSNNELSIDGQKFKVLSGENSANPSWYTAGTNDGGGGSQGGGGQAFTPPPAWNQSFTAPAFKAPTAEDLQNDVGYQEQLKRGQQAIERSAAARGTVLNPGTLKDLTDFSQGTASAENDKLYARKYGEYMGDVQQRGNEYNQRYKQYLDQYQQAAGTFGINYGVATDDINRFINQQNNAFGQQLSLAQLGMQGANNVTGTGSAYATNGGNAITGGANALASGYVGGANAVNNAIGNITNMGTSLYGLSQYGNYQPGGAAYRMPYTTGLIQ